MKLLLILLLLTHHLSAQVANDNKLNKVEFYFIHINRCYAETFSDSAIINRCNTGTDGSNKFTIKDSLTLLKMDSVLNIKSKFTTILNDTFYCDEKQNLDNLYIKQGHSFILRESNSNNQLLSKFSPKESALYLCERPQNKKQKQYPQQAESIC